jgi:polar amino acid transport system substrate-binding protein
MPNNIADRRNLLKLGTTGLVGGLALAVEAPMSARKAAAEAASDSLLRTVLDRGHLIVGTGSTNAPWHFENEKGELVGMDIAMAKILAKGLFDDETKVEYVRQDPAARIPNTVTGKIDITIQFMTVSANRAQLVNFTRPYYVEGVALLTRPDSPKKSFDALLAAGADATVSILQNVDAEEGVHKVLPKAVVQQLDTQANVIQALDSKRVDAAAVDLSTVRWLVARNPGRYADSGKWWNTMLYAAAVRQSDLDWLTFINTTWNVAMFGHQNEIYDAAYQEYFGQPPTNRVPGFPTI